MKIEIQLLDTHHQDEVMHAVELLNKTQSSFVFELAKSSLSFEEDELRTAEVYQQLKAREDKQDHFVVLISDKYLIGKEYRNLFGEIFVDQNVPDRYAIVTTYGVLDLLDIKILEIYIMGILVRYTSMFFAKESLTHIERSRNFCMFDFMIAKEEINDVLKTGNICLECQIKMDQHLSITQIFSLNKVARIIGRITRSKNPQLLFKDYLALIGGSESERELAHVESTISKLSRLQGDHPDPLDSNQLEQFIIAGKIKEAFDNILARIEEGESRDNFLLLYSRFNALNEDIHKGLLTYEMGQVERNKIIDSTLYFIREL